MMRKKIWNSLILLLVCLGSYGQNFDYAVAIDPVNEEGHYRILLAPEVLGKLSTNYADLRLFDEQENESPYAIYSEQLKRYISSFREYEILENVALADSISYLVFRNPGKQAIDNVSLIIRNNAVRKMIRLSGSDDQDNWYAITDYNTLQSTVSSDSTSELQIIDFPLSNYEYFKLEIDNEDQLPLAFQTLGYYDRQILEVDKTSFDCPIVNQTDSLKKTFIKVDFKELVYFEELKFAVNSDDYYSREGSILVKRTRQDSKDRTIEYFDHIGNIYLGSDRTNEVNLNGVSLREFYIEIHNDDNEPLQLTDITAYLNKKYVVAKLKPEAKYFLKFGNENLRSPRYDIQEFVGELDINEGLITHGSVQFLRKPVAEELKPDGLFDNPVVLWTIIIMVGALFTLISVSMVRKMSREE